MNKTIGRVAVITVCFNDLPGLRKTLNSVSQQAPYVSVNIVVDGGSSDGSVAYLTEQGTDILSWSSGPDGGIYDAMNRGLAQLPTNDVDLVVFMNSGDTFATAHTVRQMLESHRVDGWRWAFGEAELTRGGQTIGIHAVRHFAHWRFMVGLASIPHQTVYLTPKLLHEIGPFNLDAGLSADQEHLLRAWLVAKPALIPARLAICDGDGVGSGRLPHAFPFEMRQHRRANSCVLAKSMALDAGISVFAASLAWVRHGLLLLRSLYLASRQPRGPIASNSFGQAR